jgi:two-component system sensor histidine kinase PilS (NtrC family)
MFLRVALATFLLGAALLLQLREPQGLLTPHRLSLYGLIATTYLLSLFYVYLLKVFEDLEALAYLQIGADILLETVLVYLTGLEESVFASIYNLSIITGSTLLYQRGGLTAAFMSSFLYGGLLNLRYFGVVPLGGGETLPPVGSEIYYTLLVNMSAFFLVAFLSSYLAEQVRLSQRELEETQSDLSELTAIHEHILQCLQSGLITTDLEGRITFANRAAEEILNLDGEQLVGRPLEQIFPQLGPAKLRATDAKNLPYTERRKSMDYRRRDGEQIHLGFSLSSLYRSDGTPMGTIVHFQDLTQTITLEEQLRRVDRLATVGEMAARLAHEIRNPLASLSGSIQLLREELALEGSNRRLMDIVLRETQRLNGLLTDFLLFARPEKLQLEEMDLSRMLNEVLELIMERKRGDRPVEVKARIQPQLNILADPKKMRQTIWNLLNNALEAMPDGGRLGVRARWGEGHGRRPISEDSRWVLLEVEDTGEGISPEDLKHIFDPFFTTKEKGTGLGLSVVHRCIEDLGGKIFVRSRKGRGTCFTLWIPSIPPKEKRQGGTAPPGGSS